MSLTIVVPRKKISKGKKSPGGGDFWESFWGEKINENRDYFAKDFSRRLKRIDTIVNEITAKAKDANQRFYVEIGLDERATAKTSSPSDVWTEANLDVIAAKDERTLVVTGKAQDFEKLKEIGSRGSFESAITGENIRNKDKNLLRELYAMSSVTDRDAVVEGRVSNYIYDFINRNELNTSLDCIIEIYSNFGLDQYDFHFDTLNGKEALKGNIKKRNVELFFSNSSYLATLTPSEVIEVLTDPAYNFISRIKEQPFLVSQRCIPSIDTSNIRLLDVLTNEQVGIIDSGIYNPTLLKLRVQHHTYLQSGCIKDEDHGSMVASKVLFGDSFFSQLANGGAIAPTCTFIDIQVLYIKNTESACIPFDDLENAVSEVVKRYKDVAIYNLSISDRRPVDKDDIHQLTQFFDHIARKYDVIFVCSVGNHDTYKRHSYSDVFQQHESVIAPPSDAQNVISVGSISEKISSSSINTTKGFPSPFTRTADLTRDIKKPEVVISGGNINNDPSAVYDKPHLIASEKVFGVESMNKGGLFKATGTSLSAPLITRECVFLLDFIKRANVSNYIDLQGNRFNLIKALLVHSTAKVEQAKIKDTHIKRAYGFGVPDYRSILSKSDDELTIIYSDKINFVDKKHRLQIQLPENVIGKKLEFIFTLVYNPPVDSNFPKEYKQTCMTAALRLITPFINDEGKPKDEVVDLNPATSWENYRNQDHNVIHFKKIRKEVNAPIVEVMLQLTCTQPYGSSILGREESEYQAYAFILTIRDLSSTEDFRKELIRINEFEELVQNEIEEQVHV